MKKRMTAAIICIMVVCTAVNVSAGYESEFGSYVYEADDGTVIPYRLYVPDGIDGEVPLVIFLHGAGSRGDDNYAQLIDGAVPHLFGGCMPDGESAVILAPQCPIDEQWVDTPWADGAYSTDEVAVSNEVLAVMDIAAMICAEYAVDISRLYITGLSMGGFGTWDIITRYPDVFAAALPICGGGDPSKAEVLASSATALYTVHGDIDPVVPYSGTFETVQAIKDAGGEIEFITYEGGRHNVWNPTYSDPSVFEWMFSQRLDDTSTAEAVMRVDAKGISTASIAESDDDTSETDTAEANSAMLGTAPTVVAIAAIVLITAALVAAKHIGKH